MLSRLVNQQLNLHFASLRYQLRAFLISVFQCTTNKQLAVCGRGGLRQNVSIARNSNFLCRFHLSGGQLIWHFLYLLVP